MAVTDSVAIDAPRRPKRQRSAAIAEAPSKAEIIEDIRIGLRQAAAGEGRPAHEAFADLRDKRRQ